MNTRTTTLEYLPAKAKAGQYVRSEIVVFLSVLVIFVVSLSFLFFSNQSLRLDEAQSIWQTSRSPMAILHMVSEDVHVPLYHIVLHYWQSLFGNTVFSARMLSLLFFVLMIPAIYMVGKKAYSDTVGLFAALMVAVSPFLNWFGNEIRMYSLFALLTVLNQYFFMKIFSGELDEKGRVPGRIWAGYIATLVIGMFTHYFFAFNAITQAIFYVIYRKQFPKEAFKMFLLSGLFLIVVFSPWVYFVINSGSVSNTQPALSSPSSIDLFNTFSQFVFGFQNDHTNTILVSMWPILVLLIFLSLRRNQKISPKTIYLFFSLIIPIALAFFISQSIKPIYVTRYLILSLPSLYLLISWVLSTYPLRLARVFKTLLVILMFSTLAIEIVNANSPVKENYREASQYLEQRVTPNDVIVLSAPFTVYPFEYYYKGQASIETLPKWDRFVSGPIPAFSDSELAKDAESIKDSHQILWLLLSYDQGYEENIRLYFDTRYERIDTKNFSKGINLYAYKLRYDDTSLATAMKNIGVTGFSSPQVANIGPTSSSVKTTGQNTTPKTNNKPQAPIVIPNINPEPNITPTPITPSSSSEPTPKTSTTSAETIPATNTDTSTNTNSSGSGGGRRGTTSNQSETSTPVTATTTVETGTTSDNNISNATPNLETPSSSPTSSPSLDPAEPGRNDGIFEFLRSDGLQSIGRGEMDKLISKKYRQ